MYFLYQFTGFAEHNMRFCQTEKAFLSLKKTGPFAVYEYDIINNINSVLAL